MKLNANKLLTSKNLAIAGAVVVGLYFVNQSASGVTQAAESAGQGIGTGATVVGVGAAAALILLVLI